MGEDAQRRFRRLRTAEPGAFTPRRQHPSSGYYLLGDRLETEEEIRMLVDAGPLGYLSIAAHGHADALAVVLNVAGTEVLVDPGTYCYHTEPEWRSYFRGTQAHNTVVVDGEDQSVQVGNFMWTRHATAQCLEFSTTNGAQRFVGQHNGYERLRDPVIHRRQITFSEARREIEITDVLECKGTHTVARHWHFSERISPAVNGAVCEVTVNRFRVILEPMEPIDAVRLFDGGAPREGGWISRSFGAKRPCKALRWTNSVHGTTVLRTRLRFVANQRQPSICRHGE